MDFAQLIKEEVSTYEHRTWEGELAGQEVKIHSKPLTPRDFDLVLRKFPDFMTQTQPAGMCLLIARKAEDENGQRLLQNGQEVLLQRLDVRVVGEMFGSLFGADMEDDVHDIEDMEKN